MSNINFLTAHVINLLSNAKKNVLTGGGGGGGGYGASYRSSKSKVSGSRNIGFYIRSFDGFHKCTTTTEVRSVQFMDIETVH